MLQGLIHCGQCKHTKQNALPYQHRRPDGFYPFTGHWDNDWVKMLHGLQQGQQQPSKIRIGLYDDYTDKKQGDFGLTHGELCELAGKGRAHHLGILDKIALDTYDATSKTFGNVVNTLCAKNYNYVSSSISFNTSTAEYLASMKDEIRRNKDEIIKYLDPGSVQLAKTYGTRWFNAIGNNEPFFTCECVLDITCVGDPDDTLDVDGTPLTKSNYKTVSASSGLELFAEQDATTQAWQWVVDSNENGTLDNTDWRSGKAVDADIVKTLASNTSAGKAQRLFRAQGTSFSAPKAVMDQAKKDLG